MVNITLSAGPVTSTDVLTVELITAIETPAIVRVTWPAAPTVMDPRRFPAMSLAVVALMDQALVALREVGEA